MEDDQGRYSLTAVGETLRSDVPGTLREWVRFVLGEECRIAWGGLINSVRTGEAAFDNIFGADVWTYRAQHPASARLFDDAMGNVSNVYHVAVLATYPFYKFKKLVDVGGGNASFMVAFLRSESPHDRCKIRGDAARSREGEAAGCGSGADSTLHRRSPRVIFCAVSVSVRSGVTRNAA